MKIAQVSPLCESVPPRLYGGTERVVAYLTDELVRLGHEVTLFASGDSRTRARLVEGWPTALRLAQSVDFQSPHVLLVEHVAQQADDFDIIHFHMSPFHLPIARRLRTGHVTTLHGRLDLAELGPLFREFTEVPVVSISDAQRTPLPDAHWVGTVHHGLPPELLPFQPAPGEYLAFMGRISPEKRVDRAIAIATACGIPLRIAAKVDAADRDYFERDIRHRLDNPLVEFIGEIGDAEKRHFLGRARALLFPIDWPEPFGLVMIEALACGAPIVAFRAGSVAEVVEHGVTGFVVDTLEEAIDATRRVDDLSRAACRAAFERRFHVTRMATDYLRIYDRLAARAGAAVITGAA
jgi:glycosyltransferase involved in cell wall biosynthesis